MFESYIKVYISIRIDAYNRKLHGVTHVLDSLQIFAFAGSLPLQCAMSDAEMNDVGDGGAIDVDVEEYVDLSSGAVHVEAEREELQDPDIEVLSAADPSDIDAEDVAESVGSPAVAGLRPLDRPSRKPVFRPCRPRLHKPAAAFGNFTVGGFA